LADFTGGPARELLNFTGHDNAEADDLSLQWSPDGTTIAFSAYYPTDPFTVRVFLYDAVTGRETATIENASLVGSVAFSPDSARLLIADGCRSSEVSSFVLI
jgi:Tol biopolymer transport system component